VLRAPERDVDGFQTACAHVCMQSVRAPTCKFLNSLPHANSLIQANCRLICRVGQNRIYAPYMTVYLVISLPTIPYTHRIYMILANPIHLQETKLRLHIGTKCSAQFLTFKANTSGGQSHTYIRIYGVYTVHLAGNYHMVIYQRGLTEDQNGQVFICSLTNTLYRISYTPPNWQAPNFNMNVCGCIIRSLPIGGRVLNLLWRAGHFLPQIVHTNSPTAPI